jgi:hypothetical protein
VNRRDFIALLSGAAALSPLRPLAAYAQQSKAPRIGALVLTDQDGRDFGKAFREGLRELGLIEGENYVLELRSADAKADRLPQLAQELVRLRVRASGSRHSPSRHLLSKCDRRFGDQIPTTVRFGAAALRGGRGAAVIWSRLIAHV